MANGGLSDAQKRALLGFDGMDLSQAQQFLDLTTFEKEIRAQSGFGSGGGFDFSGLFSADTWIGLFTGEAGDLIRYDMPTFKVELGVNVPIPPSVRLGPVSFGISAFGSIDLALDFGCGYDTAGIIKALDTGEWLSALDGFYIADFDRNGNERPEIVANLRMGLDAGVSLFVLRGGVRGGVNIEGTGDLNDLLGPDLETGPDGDILSYGLVSDGRLRGTEFWTLLSYGGGVNPQNLMDFALDADFEVSAYADRKRLRGGWKEIYSNTFVDLDLFDLRYDAVDPQLVNLGHMEGSTLYVHAGERAGQRGLLFTQDSGENIVLHDGSLGGGNVGIEFNGWYQEFAGVTEVVLDMGQGDDTVDATRLTNASVRVTGAEGDDQILLGAAGGSADGGAGDDLLTGAGAADLLVGGDGADTLTGLDGADTLDGGAGDDNLQGGADGDTYRFADGWGDDILRDSGEGHTLDFSAATAAINGTLRARGVDISGAAGGSLSLRAGVSEVITGQGDDALTVSDISAGTLTIRDSGGSDHLGITMGKPGATTADGTVRFIDGDETDFDRITLEQTRAADALDIDDGAVTNGRESVAFDTGLERLEVIGRNALVTEGRVDAFGG